jgi:hypothetical protein
MRLALLLAAGSVTGCAALPMLPAPADRTLADAALDYVAALCALSDATERSALVREFNAVAAPNSITVACLPPPKPRPDRPRSPE